MSLRVSLGVWVFRSVCLPCVFFLFCIESLLSRLVCIRDSCVNTRACFAFHHDDRKGAGRGQGGEKPCRVCQHQPVPLCCLQQWHSTARLSPSRRNLRAQAPTPASPVATSRPSPTPMENSAFTPGKTLPSLILQPGQQSRTLMDQGAQGLFSRSFDGCKKSNLVNSGQFSSISQGSRAPRPLVIDHNPHRTQDSRPPLPAANVDLYNTC